MIIENNIALFQAINTMCGHVPAAVWMFLSLLGTGWVVFALSIWLILWSPRIFYALVITTPIAGAISRAAKVLIAAPRPPALLEPGSFILLGDALKTNAMPSGHTITAFAAAACVVFASRGNHRHWLTLLFPLALAIGVSRIAIGVHWPEDVFVGALIGLASGFIGAHLARRLSDPLMQPHSWWLRILSIWGVLCIYVLITQKLDFPENRPAQLIIAALASLGLAFFWVRSLAPKGKTQPPA